MANLDKLNQGAIALDEARRKRLMINEGDFELYMQERDNSEHANVKPAHAFTEDVITFFNIDQTFIGPSLPWAKTHEQFRLRPAEVTIWAGYSGHGKSLVLGQVMLHVLQMHITPLKSQQLLLQNHSLLFK